MEALDEVIASVTSYGHQHRDAWGTTKQSPSEIAKKIAESNSDAVEDASEDLTLTPQEEKYQNLDAMTRDIKKLDEVFEVLASVPWLDENKLEEKELKGVAMVGLIGTLEEVGFDIRKQIADIWRGERSADLVVQGTKPNEQAALLSILFHTKHLEDTYGPAPFKINV
eukprot:CAMPEP_0175059724 /NCGR_PEP_ID=MMETSP0052_2-20121109/12592_1 /TAXON_ID=51329 ORGANISM="Polytomella parva, Strain SAG 63-3" /NCGR_SAMPLE_ID=MMETSP0052_2 /ASSEMBLY_ACC=CAM_ASM_000194 /LENGTH=167 /DNA_ID=CAMNT_0016325307 /DNA_START=194 /DNA_END=697 /DNA_ORIENTATION=+